MKKQNNIISEPGLTNQLKKGTTINGDLTSESDARIDGIVNGNLNVKGKIIIGPTGEVTGDITCSVCEISGKVKGKLNIDSSLTLKSSANYTGEMSSNKLIIEPGAVFNGTCKMESKKNAPGFTNEKK
ncbi:MAG: polymer-forming cytoskeletal protein [Bacteroidales bacterium]|nr:polymer-forming cytoskeletal protein [Bacteroidales bacterium]